MMAAPANNGQQEGPPVYAHQSRAPKSPSPSPSHQGQQPQHRRGYQACDPCRKRKVKCDLGSKTLSSLLGSSPTRAP